MDRAYPASARGLRRSVYPVAAAAGNGASPSERELEEDD
jgi:hypothetical protein